MPGNGVQMRGHLNCFFIVGAPGAGTTAMSRYLRKHPAICFSDPKETHFFPLSRDDTSPETLRKRFISAFFSTLTPQAALLGEGSISTLYSPEAIRRMIRTFPEANFIVMPRDPVQLVQSYRERLVFLRKETEDDFTMAWNLQEARARGEHVPKRCRDARILQYREVGRLGYYTEQLFRLEGRERCRAILFENLISQPLDTYRKALEFLDLPDDGQVTFKKISSVPIESAPLAPELVARLRHEFRGEIENLGRILGRDLSHWATTGNATANPDMGRHHTSQGV